MPDTALTQDQLIAENTALRQRVAAMEALETTHQQTQEALQTSEVRFRHLLEGSVQGVFLHRDGIIEFANDAMVRLFGYERPADLMGQDYRVIVAPWDRDRLEGYRRARLQGQDAPSYYECQGIRQDGSFIWFECLVSRVSWEGRPAVMSTFLDITARKQAEEVLKQSHEMLERRVAERTAALQHANIQLQAEIAERHQMEEERHRLETQLRQMQKMDAIGTLAGGIAHEFNNVLAAMLGFTQLATSEVPAESSVFRYLQEVRTAGTRAKDLVQQILAFSYPSAQERKPVSLPLVSQEALNLLRASLPTTIAIRQQIAPETGRVLADATQLHQVLMNLCSNAGYAMQETGGTLEVGVDTLEVDADPTAFHPEMSPGLYTRLTVRDTGVGISADTMERIYEPFFTTKGIGEGTGMGLAIVHSIVTSHGGVITVESTPGEGTLFIIYLPQIGDVPGDSLTLQASDLPQGTGNLLFVDDEAMLARLAQERLGRLGYDVVTHTSSLDALKAFQGEPNRFDLVITDQTMPHLTGEALARQLRDIRPDIPIILCTGFSHTINATKARAMGIDAFCMKPLDIHNLAVTIEQVLAGGVER